MGEIIIEIIYVVLVAYFIFWATRRLDQIDIELEKQRKKTDFFIEIIKIIMQEERKEKGNGHQQCHTNRETN